MKLKHSQVAPVRTQLIQQQGGKCALCERSFTGKGAVKPALDHCHVRGHIRDVLCLNCNGMEGKMFNLARRMMKDAPSTAVERLLSYWTKHQTSQHGLIHPTHKTETEKRVERNAKARKKRAAAKATKG